MADNEEQNTEPDEVETEEVDTSADEEADEVEEDAFAEERTKLKGSLSKERKLRAAAEKRAKAAEHALAAKDKPAEETVIDEAKREAAAEATKRANERIVKAEVKAAAKGRFADPEDVGLYLDLTEFVDDDGEVDADAIDDALTELLEKKPHLSAEKKRFQGGGHQGARAKARPGQVTEAELARMTPQEIVKAESEGRLDALLGKK